MKFISNPTIIDAEQFTDPENPPRGVLRDGGTFYVVTIQGTKIVVKPGEWIVKEDGAGDQYYPIAPEVFAKRYRPLGGRCVNGVCRPQTAEERATGRMLANELRRRGFTGETDVESVRSGTIPGAADGPSGDQSGGSETGPGVPAEASGVPGGQAGNDEAADPR